MVTKTQPKRQPNVTPGHVTLTWQQEDHVAHLLGFSRVNSTPVLTRLAALLSQQQTAMRAAPLAPLRPHILASHKPVLSQARKLHDLINSLPGEDRRMMPAADRFVPALVEFHDQVAIGIAQMEGVGVEGGGGKKRHIKKTRENAEHAMGVFWDLNAIKPSGQQQTEGLTERTYSQNRQTFVEFCRGLIGYSAN